MQKNLLTKFLMAYLAIGVICFIMISTLGSRLIENRVTELAGTRLYHEAVNISDQADGKDYSSEQNMQDALQNLRLLAAYQDCEICYINTEGSILMDTETGINTEDPVTLDNFDPVALGSDYYSVGNFFGYFRASHLSVMIPVSDNMKTRGYIAIHMPVSELIKEREVYLTQIHRLFLILYLLAFVIMGIYVFMIYRPLQKISNGVSRFAEGDLEYNIPVSSDDEIGYLASSLNYMSDELGKSEQAQRKFVSNVSHDFRSPLTSIKGFVEAILDGTIPPEMQNHYLKIVLQEVERLQKLTENVLTLNRMDRKSIQLELTEFDINQIIRDTAASFEATCLKRHITFDLLLEGKELFVYADLGKIQQVLYNLIDNAVKFSNDKSRIQIETGTRRSKVYVSVKDFGIGMPPGELNKIWDRFYKVDSSRGKDTRGTGLGLSIVKEIINAHRETITVVSTEGVGTEFTFTLKKSASR